MKLQFLHIEKRGTRFEDDRFVMHLTVRFAWWVKLLSRVPGGKILLRSLYRRFA